MFCSRLLKMSNAYKILAIAIFLVITAIQIVESVHLLPNCEQQMESYDFQKFPKNFYP